MMGGLLPQRCACGRIQMLWTWWLLCSQAAMAAVYRVGGPVGWTNYNVHTNQLPDYTAWSSSHQPFYPGDQFLFQYTPNFHTIHQFPNQSDYENCNFNNATQLDDGHSGTFMWEALDIGTSYFGCKTPVEGFGYHCNDGQKVAIRIEPML